LVLVGLNGRELWRIEGWKAGGAWNSIQSIALSPDRKRIALEGVDRALYVLMDSYQVIEIPDSVRPKRTPGIFYSIDWSPDSRSIVFARNDKIQSYDVDTRQTRVIASGTNPTWAPNGRGIAYRAIDGIPMLLAPLSGTSRAIFTGRKIVGSIRWSPDSDYVLYTMESSGLVNRVQSAWSLFAPYPFRLMIHRLRDGVEIIGRSAIPMGEANQQFWIKK
jgi:WD40 repeat protein